MQFEDNRQTNPDLEFNNSYPDKGNRCFYIVQGIASRGLTTYKGLGNAYPWSWRESFRSLGRDKIFSWNIAFG